MTRQQLEHVPTPEIYLGRRRISRHLRWNLSSTKIYQIWISLASSLLFLFDVTLESIQSQPCHWRNIKSVTKRDVSNTTITSELAESEKKEKSVSDNISLFQSLRVLQEGEGEDSYSSSTRSN